MKAQEPRRPDPDQLLRQVQAEEEYARRGRLKVFLGYASGVGKSFRMLDEGRRRKERGQDVVVGATQPAISLEIQPLLEQLESIPVCVVQGMPVMDVTAILQRHPSVCLVDGLAYNNPPGSRHATRWQDVEQLLDAGISILTSLNIQHIAEKSEAVAQVRGRRVESTVPEAFLQRAEEIVVVDAPADEGAEGVEGALSDGKRLSSQQLSELREIALLLAADVVDHQLESYLQRNGITQHYGTQERVMVCLTPRTDAEQMIHRGRRQADRFHGDLYAVYVDQINLSPEDRASLERNLQIARDVGAEVHVLDGEDVIDTLVRFARQHGVTQLFVGHSLRAGWSDRLFGTPLERLLLQAEGMDVRVFPHQASENA